MPPIVDDLALLVHEVDDGVGRLAVELGGVGAGQPAQVAGELDHHRLHAQAQAQAGDLVLAGVAGGGDLALDGPGPEAAGDDDAVDLLQPALGQQALDVLGLDPVDLDPGAVGVAAVAQGLDHRQVGVGQAVLADEADAHDRGGRLDPVDQRPPVVELGGVLRPGPAEQPAQVVVEALLVEDERDLVEVAGVDRADDRLLGHVAQQGDLALEAQSEMGRSLRQTMTSGWMPRLRSSVTECWVGLVFCSPDGPR